MALDMNSVFKAVSNNVPADDETVRSIAGAGLTSRFGAGASQNLISPDPVPTQAIRISSGVDQGLTGTSQSPRAQILPATDNKLPRIYGRATTGGILIDHHETDANTIIACFALTEYDKERNDAAPSGGSINSGKCSIRTIWRDGQRMVPISETVTGGGNTIVKIQNVEDNSNIDVQSANVLHVWAWAGNSDAQCQIFGPRGQDNAYDIFPTWTSANTMDGTAFAIVEVKYLDDEPNDLKIDKLGSWRFEFVTTGENNDLDCPANAFVDYMTSSRYGAGLSTSDIDMDSVAEWVTHCNQTNIYDNQWQDPKGAVPVGPATYNRFQMGAWLDTNDTVATNIQKILDAGMATMTYDYRQGKFRVIPNRAMATTITGPNESYTIFNFNANNIISGITVNSTDLYSLYNAAETNYPDFRIQDRAEMLIVQTDSSELLSNEPTAVLSFDQPCVNFRPQAADIANITLKQSRVDTVVSLTGDFTCLGVDVGDFVSVTDQTKGWDTKYFRVKRTQERNLPGGIEIDFVLQEYSDRPFERVVYQNADNDPFATGTMFYANYGGTDDFTDENLDFTPVIANVYVADNAIQWSGQANIIDPSTGTKVGTDTSGMPIGSFNGITDFDGENWLNIDYDYSAVSDPDNFTRVYIDFDYQDTAPTHVSPATSNTRFINDVNVAGRFSSSDTVRLDKLTTGNYKISLSFSNTKEAVPEKISQVTQTANIFINPRFPSTQTNNKLQGVGLSDTYGDGTHINQTQFIVTPNTTAYSQKTPQINHDICNAAPGTWTLSANTTMTWTSTTGVAEIGASTMGNVTFANQSNNESLCFQFNAGASEDSGNVAYMANSALKGNLVTTTATFSTDPLHYGLDPNEYYATRCNVYLNAKVTNVTSPSITWKYDIRNKSPYYRH